MRQPFIADQLRSLAWGLTWAGLVLTIFIPLIGGAEEFSQVAVHCLAPLVIGVPAVLWLRRITPETLPAPTWDRAPAATDDEGEAEQG